MNRWLCSAGPRRVTTRGRPGFRDFADGLDGSRREELHLRFVRKYDQLFRFAHEFLPLYGPRVGYRDESLLYRSRYFSADTGRFIGEDRLRWGAGLNWYTYVSNEPVLLSDPMGQKAKRRKPPLPYPDLNTVAWSVLSTQRLAVRLLRVRQQWRQ